MEIARRTAVEETYSKSLTKLAKVASNSTQVGTFAPLWDSFRTLSEQLASCHSDLGRRLQELIRDVHKYSEEQLRVHKKIKEEVASTLEATQVIQSTTHALQKAREAYVTKHSEQERLKKEGNVKELEKTQAKSRKAMEVYKMYTEKYSSVRADFETKMTETAQKFQTIEESHLQTLHAFIGSFSQAMEDTHLQVGKVHTEFRQQVKDVTVENLIWKYVENKGTGKDKPGLIEFEECSNTVSTQEGQKRRSRIAFARKKKEKDADSTEPPDAESLNSPEVDDEGFSIRPEVSQNESRENNNFFSSSDSDSDDDKKRFQIQIKPVQPQDTNHNSLAAIEQLKASVGSIVISSPATVRRSPGMLKRNSSNDELSRPRRATTPVDAHNTKSNSDLLASLDPLYAGSCDGAASKVLVSQASQGWSLASSTGTNVQGSLVPPLRPPSRPKSAKLGGIEEVPRQFSPPLAPLARAESSSSMSSASLSAATTPTFNTSRGPSPLTLSTQDAVPIAAAFTESISAYFKGSEQSKCVVKIIGEMTLSFPAGITKVFANNPAPAALSFRLRNAGRLDHLRPSGQVMYSEPSQGKSDCLDFTMNMPALTTHLKKLSEHSPSATYYNVDILRYEVTTQGAQSVPLHLSVVWRCEETTTNVRLDYQYHREACSPPTLSNVQVAIPVDGGVSSMQAVPNGLWNAEQKRALWKITEISEKSENAGCGSIQAQFALTSGPSCPATLAVQFTCDGCSLSGVELELLGSGYRLSLLKKRMTTAVDMDSSACLGGMEITLWGFATQGPVGRHFVRTCVLTKATNPASNVKGLDLDKQLVSC
uniref:FCH and mu domain containing endocytic adaptor 2 n=1 Tax=Eptatretus burgeri TaxID=7764 RepID=A0A8C4WV63_EPTBU